MLVEIVDLKPEEKENIKYDLVDVLKKQYEGLSYLTVDYVKNHIFDLSK